MLLGITSANYGSGSGGALCTNCTSLPVSLSRWFFDSTLLTAALLALALLIVLSGLFFMVRASLLKTPILFLNAALIITLLVSPYLFNYDFIILLVPFAVLLGGKGELTEKVVVFLCYLIPTIAIIIYDRAGNISLLIVTVILTALLFLRAKSQVDVPALTAYNTNH